MVDMTVGEIRVRPGRPDDEDALHALDLAAWDPTATFPSVLEQMANRSFFTEDEGPDVHLVAELDGTVAGYVRLVPATPLPENAHVRRVNGLAVAPAARGLGVAGALLGAAADRAREEGAAKVTLRVLATNDAAQRVYARAGYVVEGRSRGEFRIGGDDVDDLFLARYLEVGADAGAQTGRGPGGDQR